MQFLVHNILDKTSSYKLNFLYLILKHMMLVLKRTVSINENAKAFLLRMLEL